MLKKTLAVLAATTLLASGAAMAETGRTGGGETSHATVDSGVKTGQDTGVKRGQDSGVKRGQDSGVKRGGDSGGGSVSSTAKTNSPH